LLAAAHRGYGGRVDAPLLDFFIFTVAGWIHRDQRDVID
jgi:putative transposase